MLQKWVDLELGSSKSGLIDDFGLPKALQKRWVQFFPPNFAVKSDFGLPNALKSRKKNILARVPKKGTSDIA